MKESKLVVPFADLYAQYTELKPEIDSAIESVISESAFVRGKYVDEFEQNFAEMFDLAHCVSCANGTDALYVAMRALNLKEGDEVIVPAMSWISTSETVTQANGTVVFCDIDEQDNTLEIRSLEDKITSRTVGIIPVHLYGQPADMPSIMEIAERRGLWVIEDCAQAHLASINGRKVGTFGIASTFSFYPGKNLGAMGDAGAIGTSDGALAIKMAKYARHGGIQKGQHDVEGINSRLDGIQAAILNVKLKALSKWTDHRIAKANIYGEFLAECDALTLPICCSNRISAWHLYVVKTLFRDELREHLKSVGVQTVLNYPLSLPFLPCYAYKNLVPSDFPNAFRLQNTCLSLPMFPSITNVQQEHVGNSILEFFN